MVGKVDLRQRRDRQRRKRDEADQQNGDHQQGGGDRPVDEGSGNAAEHAALAPASCVDRDLGAGLKQELARGHDPFPLLQAV